MSVPTSWGDTNEWVRKIAEGVNNLFKGGIRTNGTVTLRASQTTTVVTDRNVGKDSVILFMPLTANAATELYGATMLVTDIAPLTNQFTITHANNAQTDRNFKYIVLGQTLN